MIWAFIKGAFWLVFFAGVNVALAGLLFVSVLYERMPSLQTLADYRPRLPMRIYGAEGGLIGEFGEERRTVIPFHEFPRALVDTLLATEDARFFEHFGVDFIGMARAAAGYTAGRREGASTISMQVARNFYLRRDRTVLRKLVEIMVALEIERQFDKREILALYMNQIYLGHGSYGFAAAAREYYGKTLQELTLPEIAVLAGLPKAPSGLNPRSHPRRAKERQRHVLGRMRAVGIVGEEQFAALMTAELPPLAKTSRRLFGEADYVAEEARKLVFAKYGDAAYERGFKIYTTVQPRLQRAAQQSLRDGLLAHEARRPYPGPEKYIDAPAGESAARVARAIADVPAIGGLQPAVVVLASRKRVVAVGKDGKRYTIEGKKLRRLRAHLPGGKSASLRPGAVVRLAGAGKDARIVSAPGAQAGLVMLAADDGAVLALAGGFDFSQNHYNNVLQARRQAGSALKPFVYSAALEKGLMPASILPDTPIFLSAEETGSDESWQPKNYDGKAEGLITMRRALAKSKNLASIRLIKHIGAPYARDYLLRFGFRAQDHPPYLSLALGAGAATPLEMARAYAVFANGGYLVSPYFVSRIEDYDGNVVEREFDFRQRLLAIDRRNAFIMTSLLQSVIEEGTGAGAKKLKRADLAGKTGTTNDTRDAWFAGYGGNYVVVSWVGYPQNKTLGKKETGARAALPLWMGLMQEALQDAPATEYLQPTGVIAVDVDADNGEILPADSERAARREFFYNEDLPAGADAPAESEAGGLF